MKVLVLNGSPKAQSDTMHITNAFLEGLNKKQMHEIKVIKVIEQKIKPCLGCFNCWQSADICCIQNDDMQGILKEIVASDLIIWSFPLYCYGMPSHLKAVCDRLLPLSNLAMREEEGKVVHESKVDLSSKKYIMISGCGFPDFEGNFAPAVAQFKNCFGKETVTICISEAPMFNVKEAEAVASPLLEKIKKAGEEYNMTGKLAQETIKEIETPMIPNEVYIKNINGQ
nr:flavodoxin family protein [uncultured Cellulosilyticum sp.]